MILCWHRGIGSRMALTSPKKVRYDEMDVGGVKLLSGYCPFSFNPEATVDSWTLYSTNMVSCCNQNKIFFGSEDVFLKHNRYQKILKQNWHKGLCMSQFVGKRLTKRVMQPRRGNIYLRKTNLANGEQSCQSFRVFCKMNPSYCRRM